MLMVCMAGTAIKLNNIEVFFERDKIEMIDNLLTVNNRLKELRQLA